jgi:hypothetical protein
MYIVSTQLICKFEYISTNFLFIFKHFANLFKSCQQNCHLPFVLRPPWPCVLLNHVQPLWPRLITSDMCNSLDKVHPIRSRWSPLSHVCSPRPRVHMIVYKILKYGFQYACSLLLYNTYAICGCICGSICESHMRIYILKHSYNIWIDHLFLKNFNVK